MKYYLCQKVYIPIPNKKKEIVRIDEKFNFVSEHASQKALDNELKKSKKKDIYGVLVPDNIKKGYKFYNKNQEFIGEIVSGDNRNWYIKRLKDIVPLDFMCLRKESLEQKFIDGYFVVWEDENENKIQEG